jgi:hypothetical protein
MRAVTAIALVAVAAGGLLTAVLASRLSAAFSQFDVAAGSDSGERGAGENDIRSILPAVAPAPEFTPGAAPELLAPGAAADQSSPSDVDAFLATRAEIESRTLAATLPQGAPLSSFDIARLLASDPRMQAGLLDLARDADPEVRREATEFLPGFEGGYEPPPSE